MISRWTRVVSSLATALLHATTGCVGAQAVTTRPATPASATASADTNAAGLIQAGFGSLKQDDIAIQLQVPDVRVKLIPLDEGVIRTLSVDSYRALRDLAESRRAGIARLAAQHGLLHGSLSYVQFYALAPDARSSPLQATLTS